MAKIAPYTFWQALDNNGDPLSGGLVYTYEAGTSTPKATYTSADESVANANPVVLDASGRASIWLASGSYKFVLKTSADVELASIDNITGDASNVFGSSVVDVSSSTNVTAVYQNTVINCTAPLTLSLLDVGTAEEGFLFSVKNSSAGNVTIDPDASETIDGASTLTLYPSQSCIVVCAGTGWLVLHQDVVGLAKDNTFTGTNDFQGDLKVTGGQLQLSKGADIASASSLPLLTDGNFFDVTGTTTITSIATSGKVGTEITLQFDGVVTLTHHATDLILPSGANITTAAGDVFKFVEYASGDWVCTGYKLQSGKSLIADLTLGTAQATTSGTAKSFPVPAGKKITTLSLVGVSTNGTSNYLVRIGAGSPETTGYVGYGNRVTISGTAPLTNGFNIYVTPSSTGRHVGEIVIRLVDVSGGNYTYQATWQVTNADMTDSVCWGNGYIVLSDEMGVVQLTTVSANTFDAGLANCSHI